MAYGLQASSCDPLSTLVYKYVAVKDPFKNEKIICVIILCNIAVFALSTK